MAISIANKKIPRFINKESLLNVSLLRQALNDKAFRIQRRMISKDWTYWGVIPQSMGGFNPLLSTGFIPAVSKISAWLKNPAHSARSLNKGGHLLREVLYLVHDYLHAWSYLAINELYPKLGFGTKPINKLNFEDFVFCHLVTETVATIGLDYWYLSTVELSEICQIGTDLSTLTIAYHDKWLGEYRRFNSRFDVHRPKFFESLAKFYCSGDFYGFGGDAYLNSELIERWLNHEIVYGELQRKYTRQWLHHFRTENFDLDSRQLLAPVAISKKWQRDLLHNVSELLWEKVKRDKLHKFNFKFSSNKIWKSFSDDGFDLRFFNLNSIDEDRCYEKIIGAPNLEENFKFFFYQYISRFDYTTFDKELLKLIPYLVEKKDFKLIRHLFKKEKRIKSFGREPKDLFFLT